MGRRIRFSYFVTLLIFAASVARAEVHVFTTTDGRFLHGELMEANAERVVMKAPDGQLLTVPLRDLIGSDQDYVALRQKSHDTEVRHDFEVICTKEKTKTDTTHRNETTVVKTTYVARIKLKNRSNQPSGDLIVNYEIYFSKAEGLKTSIRRKNGVLSLPSLQAGATTSLDTEPFVLNVSDLDLGYSNANGAPPHQADLFTGVALIFMQKDRQVFEYLGPGVAKARERVAAKR